MNAISRWLLALVLAVTSAIFSAPAHAATLTPLTIDCNTAPTSGWRFSSTANAWNNNTFAQSGDSMTLTLIDCQSVQVGFERGQGTDPATVGITTSGNVSFSSKTVPSNSETLVLTFGSTYGQIPNTNYGLFIDSTVDYELFLRVGSGGSSQNSSASSTSSTMPMIAESDPVLTKNATTVSCKLPAYQFYGKPQWAAYTLKVDGVSVSTTRTDATTMPLWVINDVADALDEKATLDAGTWAWNPAWQGKELQCFVTAYGHHALGNTFSNALS